MKKNLVVLTGAGISAESGISTFRDSDGLWEQHNVDDVATPEAWQKDKALVTDFYNQRRKQLLHVKPNYGHIGLAELEKDFNVFVITQNVDNLHERAGSSSVLHLHGELTKVRSERYEELMYELSPEKYEVKVGDLCEKGYQLRPHIVWFGEAVPMMDKAVEITEKADILLVVGTSLNVYPAAGLLHYAPANIPIYLIDPKDVPVSRKGVHSIKKGASEGMKEFISILTGL